MSASNNEPSPPHAPEASPDAQADSRSRAEAVTELFRDHNQILVRSLQAKLQNEQEAREVAQESYVRLLELGRTGAISFLRAYLFKIAFNLAIDRIRTRNTRRRIDAAKLGPVEDLIEQAVVEKHIFAADDMKVFWASLAELPAHFREAFVMSRIDGISTPEIARRMGRTDRMVRRYVVHALIYCRHRIGGLTADQAKERMNHE
jgi:RNA polymerase sigma-70 factor (ECF subfamily)